MKNIVLVLMFFCAFVLSSKAQETGRIIMIKVYEEALVSTQKWTPSIRIIHSDNRVETIELERVTAKSFESANANYIKVREALDKIAALGFELKASHQTVEVNNIFIVTT